LPPLRQPRLIPHPGRLCQVEWPNLPLSDSSSDFRLNPSLGRASPAPNNNWRDSMFARPLFDADLTGFRDSVRKFLEQEAAPHHSQWEKDGQVSRELWRKAGELGFLCPTLPEEYGGSAADFRYSAVVME